MAEPKPAQQNYPPLSDINTRIRDSEEKQRLMRDRLLLIGKSLVDERAKTFSEIQEMKKTILRLEEESRKASEMLRRITEQLSGLARKEELMTLQRQFNLFRK